MVRRLREGYCTVANPYNRNQVARISLKPEDVETIVFWTRNPRPLMPYLDELESRGYPQGGRQHHGHVPEDREAAEETGRNTGGSTPLRYGGLRER